MRRYVTPSFERAVKKWHPRQKADLDEAVHTIASNPEWGEAKIGDLFGIRVCKFRSSNQLCMLVYRIRDKNSLKPSQIDETPALDLPTHAFKFLNESNDFLEHALLFGQVLRIQGAHLGQNGIEFSAIVTGKFPF